MRNKRVQMLTAFALAVILLLSGTVTVFAASPTGTDESSALSNIKEMLNALSYNEYVNNSDVFKKAENGTVEITLNGLDGVYTNSAGDVVATGPVAAEGTEPDPDMPREFSADGKKGIYVPDSGAVTWTTDAINKETGAKKYNLQIEYYPVANKSAAIERMLKINGEIPFSEARHISITKVWKTPYPLARVEVGKKQNAEELKKQAADAGFGSVNIVKDNKGKTFVEMKIPSVWNEAVADFVQTHTVRYFTTDIDKNEIRDSLVQAPTWQTYSFSDANGFVQEPFMFAIEAGRDGKVSLTLEGVNEPIVISAVKLVPIEEYKTYSEYKQNNINKGYTKGEGEIKIEAEYFSAVSDQTVYPVFDTTSAANSPSATDRTLYNAVGGEKWQEVGQWIEYDFTVEKSGLYNIVLRNKQNVLDGMSVSRALYLYSDPASAVVKEGDDGYYNGVPFEEATRMKFQYGSKWKTNRLAESFESKEAFEFYFVEGVTYKMRLQVSLGEMGDLIRRVQESLDEINESYLNILKITGTDPDAYITYNFYQKIPKTMSSMYDEGKEIADIANLIIAETGEKSSMTATLANVSDLLLEMSSDEDEVARNMEQLKTYIGSLGTWLGDAKTQPLLLDYIVVQPAGAALPKAEANFFESIWYEISGFFQSFWRKYDRMGALTETSEEESIEVWLAYGRDQSQVIRNLINNKFTSTEHITVDLKLVAGGTLLPSILAGKGPDVYLGLGAGDVINYAIRGALVPVDKMEGFEEVSKNFNDEAMLLLEIAKQNETEPSCYGLPETQSFPMMFVREDILANLDIEIPKTWDDVKEAIPKLQANNMEIAMMGDCNIFIYQNGGELFADDGMRINFDSPLVLNAFEDMCELFTMYSFPYKFDFANRFRTGEMPIGFGDYTGTYNQLKVFATELEGLWSFYPIPGIEDEEGNINNDSVSGVSAVVMITGVEENKKEKAWKFMKWYVGAECQSDYTNEMVAILGPSAKHPTANRNALSELPWTTEELSRVSAQFDNLAAIPNYPGAYIVSRYANFAFLDAYNNNANPKTSLEKYIDQINDEITRKRQEFGLEILDKTQSQSTLAVKRMQEARTAMEKAKESSGYSSSYDAVYNDVMKDLNLSITSGKGAKFENVNPLAARLEELNPELFKDAITKLKQASDCLEEYKRYELKY